MRNILLIGGNLELAPAPLECRAGRLDIRNISQALLYFVSFFPMKTEDQLISELRVE